MQFFVEVFILNVLLPMLIVKAAKTAEKTLFTYYKRTGSWNTANNVCRQQGGALLKIDSTIKSGIIDYFKDDEWGAPANVVTSDYWTGLYDAEIPSKTYTWSGDCAIQTSWVNWEIGEPDNVASDFCVRCDRDSGEWKTRGCGRVYQFICEIRPQGICTFLDYEDEVFDVSSDYTTTESLEVTMSACQEACRQSEPDDHGGRECWAVTYTQGTGQCVLFFSASPVTMMDESLRKASSAKTSSVRICYEANSNATSIPSALEDDDVQPLSTCVSNQTSSQAVVIESENVISSIGAVTHSHNLLTTTDGIESSTIDGVMRTGLLQTHSIASSLLVIKSMIATVVPLVGETVANFDPTTASICQCPCATTMTNEESAAFMSSILESMEVDKKNISSYKRKYISVPDERPSAQGIGYMGAILLTVVFGGLVLMDSARLCADAKLLIQRLRELTTGNKST